ncbi:DUF1648 domain-containing protein [Flavihumibacter profundi]|jgi:uncharacterized membrane protein|uniref:DUF1648 domain-containing protein n=1 Tax=Flavihumibacter profundi TaxID=2716883 RepID=UPI001CC671C7|nr:DUF1648 domain-containing protein [Flavihumibacter profundi]MBZ5855513.1 DUF1648 domain-containing protein [Flavihumibacter profundi]
MENRPKIKLNLSNLDNILELTSKVLLVVLWALTLFTYVKLPETIPIHFNASGKADNFGSKATLLLLPFLGTLFYLGLTQLNKYPHIFNYMTKITVDNAQKHYSTATRMLRFLKLAVLIIFSLLILLTYMTTIG